MTKKYLEESTKLDISNQLSNKIWRSRFGKFDPVSSGYPNKMSSIYISDYIMFNPNCNLSLDMVDRILPYIKFKQLSLDTIQIDRWIYKSNGLFIIGSTKPNYEIKWNPIDNTDTMEYVKTEKEKWKVVRALLQIMNDTPDEFVNFNSYQIIGFWYNKYDSWLVSWQSDTS